MSEYSWPLDPDESPYIDYNPWTRQWHQGQEVLPNFKPKKYFARPVDCRRRRGFFGRLKDALTGQGADVYVVINGDRRTLHRDLPDREQWSGWEEDDSDWSVVPGVGDDDEPLTASEGLRMEMPWARRSQRGRRVYDFGRRRFEYPWMFEMY
jgi:hypothetical protein